MRTTSREKQEGSANIWLALTLGVLVGVAVLANSTTHMSWAYEQLHAATYTVASWLPRGTF